MREHVVTMRDIECRDKDVYQGLRNTRTGGLPFPVEEGSVKSTEELDIE